METNFSFTLEGDAIHIELNGRKYRIGYQQAEMPYAEAQARCRERGGVLGSVELLRAIARHRDEEINPALVAAGKEPFSDDCIGPTRNASGQPATPMSSAWAMAACTATIRATIILFARSPL